MASFVGTSGKDDFTGTTGADTFDLTQGGKDSAFGGDGDDIFTLGAALGIGDHLNGGDGYDALQLNGDYSAGLSLAGILVNVEQINLTAGHSYNLSVSDAVNTSVGDGLWVVGLLLGASDHLVFDGSAETAQGFHLYGGAGDDTLLAGDGADFIVLRAGGEDSASAGGGDDSFSYNTGFDGGDTLDGGAGFDSVVLNGDFSAGVTLSSTTLTGVEQIAVNKTFDYKLVLNDGNVAAGQTLIINGNNGLSALGAADTLIVNGSAERDGILDLRGGAGDDQLTGGKGADLIAGNGGNDRLFGNKGADVLVGGGGHDFLNGGGGADVFAFDDGDLSTSPDKIAKLQGADSIDLSQIDADAVTGGDQAFTLVGAFSGAAGQLVLSYDAGTNRTSIEMDINGDSAADYVIVTKGDHTGFSNFVL